MLKDSSYTAQQMWSLGAGRPGAVGPLYPPFAHLEFKEGDPWTLCCGASKCTYRIPTAPSYTGRTSAKWQLRMARRQGCTNHAWSHFGSCPHFRSSQPLNGESSTSQSNQWRRSVRSLNTKRIQVQNVLYRGIALVFPVLEWSWKYGNNLNGIV